MGLVLGWPVRILVIGLLLFALFIDGTGYLCRLVNHQPLTGYAQGMPPNFGGWQIYMHRGLDLAGGSELTYQMTNFPAGRSRSEVQQTEIDIIQQRVNALGVSDAQVQTAGGNNDRIDVQLSGMSAAKAEQVIGNRYKLVTTTWIPDSSITNGHYPGYRPHITNLDSSMFTSFTAEVDPGSGSWIIFFQLNGRGADLFGQMTTAAYNASSSCSPSGQSTCAPEHVTHWLDLTQADVNNWNQDAYTLYRSTDQGGKLLVDPVIQQPITGGQAEITGSFTQQSAKDLATLLNSGALPADLHVIQSSDVGATLGADSVKQSLVAGLLGLVIVVIFMVAYYRLPGLLASLALLCYAGIVLAIFKAFAFSVTLGGAAGFILSVGMAVDANVLIFERFKEEMRAGRTIGAAVEAAVRRAWPAIRDSNTSTLITSVILIFATTGTVKGFAITLATGVAVSVLSSIIITHNLLAIVLNSGWSRTTGMLGVARR